MKAKEIKLLINKYLETHDIFWFNDMLKQIKIQTPSEKAAASKYCIELVSNNILINSEKKGSRIQYMKV